MDSQKLEDILNLSLNTPLEVREKSPVLRAGFDEEDKQWELVVKFSGNIKRIENEQIKVEILLAGYAIVTIPESLIPALASMEEIEYVEMPKQLFEEMYEAKQTACIRETDKGSDGLTGAGCLIAVFDSGIDYFLPDFQDERGSRIDWLWDQTLQPDESEGRKPPEGFYEGVEFSGEQITEAVRSGSRQQALRMVPSVDRSGHGTSVAAIAAGSNSDARYTGVAPEARLLIVKLGGGNGSSAPLTTGLMRAVAYALSKAREMGMPLVMNFSFGNNYGAHDGSSLLERYLDNAAESWKTVVCVGSGNEGASGGHISGRITDQDMVEVVVADYERNITVQLWKNFADSFRIMLRTPAGQNIVVNFEQLGKQEIIAGRTRVLIFLGQPVPYSVHQEIFFNLIPMDEFIDPGIWQFFFTARQIVSGEYQMYLPSGEVRGIETRFVRPKPELTLTIPSTTQKVITVGAMNPIFESYADFSGRGAQVRRENTLIYQNTKPDLTAPGVGITTIGAQGSIVTLSGTSFSTPIVSGCSALLMQWGIVQGNDPYLYGEKMKAVLRRGAKALRGESFYPNEKTGYGSLCLENTLRFLTGE